MTVQRLGIAAGVLVAVVGLAFAISITFQEESSPTEAVTFAVLAVVCGGLVYAVFRMIRWLVAGVAR